MNLRLQGLERHSFEPRILAVMEEVPREEFVPEHLRPEALANHALPIGHGQTISQPYIVAFMTQALAPRPTDRVLEIGTGSGYQAAILSRLVERVFSLEIVPQLARRAADTLRRLNFSNVEVRHADGHEGWPAAAPFDAIIVTCAPTEVPPRLVEQLREGGRMIVPVGGPRDDQELVLLARNRGRLARERVLPVRFVPMTGKPAD